MRRRIFLAIVGTTTVAVVIFAIPLGFALADLYREEEIVRLERAAAEGAERVPASFPDTRDPVELSPVQDARSIALYGPDGTLLAGSGPQRADAVARTALRGDVSDGQADGLLVVGAPVTRGERTVGALRVAIPLSVVSDRTRDAILLMMGIGALAIGASALIATWQSRRLTSSVLQLARDAARLGDGDFTVKTVRSGIPEIDTVSHTLDTTAARLDRMLARERSFSDYASHQLRTPLTGLRVTLEAAEMDPGLDRDAAIETALVEAARLDRTIEDLLALGREPASDRAPLDLTEMLTALDNDWHGRLAASARPLRVVTDSGIPPVAISGRALRQILDVLVDNAWHHGSGVVTVHTRATPHGTAVIEVSDEGDGIAGDVDQIFTRRSESGDGHGIGLALARSLAEAEGARLVLERSEPEPVFAIFLPSGSPLPSPR